MTYIVILMSFQTFSSISYGKTDVFHIQLGFELIAGINKSSEYSHLDVVTIVFELHAN